MCERRGKDKEKMRAQKPAAIPEPQWGCGYLTNHGLEIFVVKSLDCPPVVKWDFRSQHKSKAMSREKKFGGRKNQQLEATCCIFYRMLASVSSSWQHIYYRYLTFAFFLFNLSSHTVTFLWSCRPSQLSLADQAAAGTFTGGPGWDNHVHKAEVSSQCCIQRDTPNRITYSRKNSPLKSPSQTTSNNIHMKNSKEYIWIKSGVKGPSSSLIPWPCWHQ